MSTVLVLSARRVGRLLDMDGCRRAVMRALCAEASGAIVGPASLSMAVSGGTFHVKAAATTDDPAWFVAKTNANFPDNPARRGLPTVQGVVVLVDGRDGRPRAIIDSAALTALRTAATAAIAADHLARHDSTRLLVVGCGKLGAATARAMLAVRPIRTLTLVDRDPAAAGHLARRLVGQLPDIELAADARIAARRADIIATCTPASTWLIGRDDVAPGSFVAAMGADSPTKQEIEPSLIATTTLVVDSLDQCATGGDLHHAIAAGLVERAHARATLAQVVSGAAPGRRAADEIIIFDSTGTATQDLAAAIAVHDAARARANAWRGISTRWIRRMRLRRLLEALDDRRLRDIGLTRAGIEREINKPLWKE